MKTEKQQSIAKKISAIILLFACVGLFAFNHVNKKYSKTTIVDAPLNKTVVIKNHTFMPDTIAISVNATITWSNEDGMSHTVTSDLDLFDSHRIRPMSTFSYKFTTAGTYKYHCKYHDEMVATIIVQ